MRRLVYRTTKGPITQMNPSFKHEFTNQILEDGNWKYYNRYTGKFGERPIVWYATKDWAESFAPKDNDVADMIEWDGTDNYKNTDN